MMHQVSAGAFLVASGAAGIVKLGAVKPPAATSLDLESNPSSAMAGWRGGSFAVDARRFGGAVGIATILSIAQFFLLPRVLDVATYGAFRVFVVFGIYAGVLHLGIPDGAYVRWAGRETRQVLLEWRTSAAWLAMIQLAFALLGVLVATQFTDRRLSVTVAALGAFAASINMLTHATCALQAIGEFRRAGAHAMLPPAALLVGVLSVPGSARTLPVVLGVAVGAQVVPAIVATWWLHRAATRLDTPRGGSLLTLGSLLRLGTPVLIANIIAGLALSIDRLLLSITVPVEQFAMYGFATSAFVIGNAVTQGLARVSVPHAARLPVEERGAFYGRLYGLIATGFGAGFMLYPAVEGVIAAFLPAYAGALSIMRALLPGALFGVTLHVVVFSVLLVRQAVRTQLAIAAGAALLVLGATGVAIVLDAPLWGIAAASSAALGVAWAAGALVAARQAPSERPAGMLTFALCTAAQFVALVVALKVGDGVVLRTAIYLALAAAPTWLAWRRAS